MERRLTEEILDSLGEGVITVDQDFRITFFNRAAERITGFSRDQMLGKFCKQICRIENCREQCPMAHVLTSGEPVFDLFTPLCHATANPVHVKMNSAVLYNSEHEPVGGILSFRDLHSLEVLQEKLLGRHSFQGLIGHSRGMQEIFHLIEDIAETDASVLIRGESGTGKEMIANAIQARSHRANRPFVKVNCSVLPAQLLASELFGHVRGAFTDAVRDRQGRFEAAHLGTLFLDEVAEMAPEMQLQLLRVLQEGSFERVGESITRTVDVRIIAATNRDLEQAIPQGHFRQDLYYRLNVIPIEVPPLRQRREDIPYLVRHFIDKFSLVYHNQLEDIEDSALDLLQSYPWPGNVRELENVIEYAFARSKEERRITLGKLPPHLRTSNKVTPATTGSDSDNEYLWRALEKHQWNRARAAAELGMSRTTLWRQLKAIERARDLR